MSASNTLSPRGPLPPGVYWRRRLVVAVGGLVLVFAIAHLLGGGSDGSSGGTPVARQAGAEISTSATSSVTSPATGSASSTATTAGGPTASSSAPLVLAAPSGACDPRDITVTPSVSNAVAGRDITLSFALQTNDNPACTWQLTPHKLAVKITRRGRTLWSSQECARELPTRSVVIRNVVPSLVTMVWNGRVSVQGCRADSDWVRPGRLTIWAATLGGEPGHSDFSLVLPDAQTIAVTPRSTPSATASSTGATGKAQPQR